MARDNQTTLAPPSDIEQLRAELAMLRVQLQQQATELQREEAARKEHARYLEWVGKTAEERTQMVADQKYPPVPGDTWYEIQLQEQPKVRLPAHGDFEAVGRYNALCGITGTAHEHLVTKVDGPQASAASA